MKQRIDLERFAAFRTAIEEAAQKCGYSIDRVVIDEDRRDGQIGIVVHAQQERDDIVLKTGGFTHMVLKRGQE